MDRQSDTHQGLTGEFVIGMNGWADRQFSHNAVIYKESECFCILTDIRYLATETITSTYFPPTGLIWCEGSRPPPPPAAQTCATATTPPAGGKAISTTWTLIQTLTPTPHPPRPGANTCQPRRAALPRPPPSAATFTCVPRPPRPAQTHHDTRQAATPCK